MSDTQKWQLLVLTIIIGALLYWLGPVLTPFVLSALFAYLGDPIVDRLERWKLSRTGAVTIVFTAMFVGMVAILLWFIPFTERQIGKLLNKLPSWIAWFEQQALPWLQEHTGFKPELLDPDQLVAMLQEHWRSAGGVATQVLTQVSKSGLAIVHWLVNLMLIPVVTFYLLRDWDVLVERVRELIPRTVEPTVSQLARESDDVLGAFLRGQLLVMLVLGAMYGMALWAIGLDVGPLIGMFAGLISFVPYLGAMLGVVAGLIAAWVQFGDWLHLILVLVVFGVGHAIEGYVLVPRLIGDKIGLHPVAVMFAILAGGQLFGFLGVLVALPVASVIMVVLRHAHARYKASELYGAGQARTEANLAAEAAMVASALPVASDSVPGDAAPAQSAPQAPPEKPA